jgi:hypothetical protein
MTNRVPDYASIDPILRDWVRERGVRLVTEYKDEIVRSIPCYASGELRGHIWVDFPDGASVNLHAARSGASEQLERCVRVNELRSALDELWRNISGRSPPEDDSSYIDG